MFLKDVKARVKRYFRGIVGGQDTDTEGTRAKFDFYWKDHHILRKYWHNFAPVAADVYRSNQPDAVRYKAYHAQGIRSVLNLRGESTSSFYGFTKDGCDVAGLTLYNVGKLSARRAPDRDALLEVFKVFDTAERGLLIHCKSGADRTGLISTFYLIDKMGESLASARRHLSFRYLHVRWSHSGILDMMLDDFARVEGQKSLRQWIAEDYSAEDLTARYKAKR